MIIQLCGLPGSGKTTLANKAKEILAGLGLHTEIIDGDVYRKTLCADLGFSKADRQENIRRLAAIAHQFSLNGSIAILSAINPYEEIRQHVVNTYKKVKTVYLQCPLEVLIKRDPKGLYKRALLPVDHPDKIENLTGINDPFEIPGQADFTIPTADENIESCSAALVAYILFTLKENKVQ